MNTNTRWGVTALICIVVLAFIFVLFKTSTPAPEPQSTLPQAYSNKALGFSIRLPADYTIDESYKYQAFGPGKDIAGVKFTIPASVAAGTNLGSDSYISVEEIPNGDTIFDLKILPDRAHDLLSHQGVAREIAGLR